MKKILKIALLGLFAYSYTYAGTVTAPDMPMVSHTDAPAVIFPKVLDNIGWCESHNKADAHNASSTAKGRFEFLDSSWTYYGSRYWGSGLKYRDVMNYSDNTELALYVYGIDGTAPWNSSDSCWKPMAVKDV